MASDHNPSSLLGRTIIPTISKIQEILAQLGEKSFAIDLPQVVAVGGQGSGKSSVIESLVGKDFLPRGGAGGGGGGASCTRRPVVIQLVRHKREEEWGEFEHLVGKRFSDFDEIKRQILAEAYREAGGDNWISEKPIHLKIFSQTVLSVTLVELPGITKVHGDLEANIQNLIISYIRNPSCIILAVSPANEDLTNSNVLQLARLVDPDGSRTIGVITKLDIMDRGTDARNFLLGKVNPLKLGYFGVVNRSQEDAKFNRSIKDSLAFEQSFFSTIQAYKDLSHCCGVPQLAEKLNQVLVQKIRSILPSLKSQINTQLVEAAKEHVSYGSPEESKESLGVKLLNILAKYCEAFSSMVEGKSRVSTEGLSGGARIHYIFQSIFVKRLEEVDPCEGITDQDIRIAIHDSAGPKSALFLPEVPFEILVRRQISRLLDPSLQCARFIYDELLKMSQRCLVDELYKYPVLRKRMDDVITNFIKDRLIPAEKMITRIIHMQMDYINTSHPSFIGGSEAVEIAKKGVKPSNISTPFPKSMDNLTGKDKNVKLRAIFARGPATGFVAEQGPRLNGNYNISAPYGNAVHKSFSTIHLREPPVVLKPGEIQTERETEEIAIMKLLLNSYYDLVRQYIEDSIPKAIMHFLVNHTKRELHNVLIRKLYRENLLEEMLREPDDVSLKKKRVRETLRLLEQAQRAMEELSLDSGTVEREQRSERDATGLPRARNLTSSFYATTTTTDDYFISPKFSKSRKSIHSQ